MVVTPAVSRIKYNELTMGDLICIPEAEVRASAKAKAGDQKSAEAVVPEKLWKHNGGKG